jgi:hypothetical protein
MSSERKRLRGVACVREGDQTLRRDCTLKPLSPITPRLPIGMMVAYTYHFDLLSL